MIYIAINKKTFSWKKTTIYHINNMAKYPKSITMYQSPDWIDAQIREKNLLVNDNYDNSIKADAGDGIYIGVHQTRIIAIDLKKNMWYETDISHIANHVELPGNINIDICIAWIENELKEQNILKGKSEKIPFNDESHESHGKYIYLAV